MQMQFAPEILCKSVRRLLYLRFNCDVMPLSCARPLEASCHHSFWARPQATDNAAVRERGHREVAFFLGALWSSCCPGMDAQTSTEVCTQ